jgi:HNH endonuclease
MKKKISDIKGLELYENYYVCSSGVVFSTKKGGPAAMKPVDINGYKQVGLSFGKQRKAMLVHRLVALAFLDNPENHPQVNHKNGIKSDNSLENLEWCNAKQNMHHADAIGIKPLGSGYKDNAKTKRKLNEKQINWIINMYKDNHAIKTISEYLKIDSQVIYQILNRKTYKEYTALLEWPPLNGDQHRKTVIRKNNT